MLLAVFKLPHFITAIVAIITAKYKVAAVVIKEEVIVIVVIVVITTKVTIIAVKLIRELFAILDFLKHDLVLKLLCLLFLINTFYLISIT